MYKIRRLSYTLFDEIVVNFDVDVFNPVVKAASAVEFLIDPWEQDRRPQHLIICFLIEVRALECIFPDYPACELKFQDVLVCKFAFFWVSFPRFNLDLNLL